MGLGPWNFPLPFSSEVLWIYECSYCIFLFFIFQVFLKLRENVPLFLAHACREEVFSLKAYFGGVMGLHLLRNFYFVFSFTLQKSKERCQRSSNKSNFSLYRYFPKWTFHWDCLAVACSYLISSMVSLSLRNFRPDLTHPSLYTKGPNSWCYPFILSLRFAL